MPTNTAVNLARTYVEDGALPARRESALQLIRQLLALQDVSPVHHREMLSIGLWKWTEAEGVAPHAKYHIRLRSLGALDLSEPVSINHEHVWPRKWIIDQLLSRTDWPDEDLRDFLERYAVACTVTVEEHARLSAVKATGWARYAAAGIKVWDMLEDQPFELPGTEDVTTPRPDEEETPEDVGDEAAAHADVAVTAAIEARAGDRADAIKAVLAGLGDDVVVAVGMRKDPAQGIGGYLRIHDNVLEEPSPAIAYLHWNGKLSVRLVAAEVPRYLLDEPTVHTVNHKSFGVELRVVDADTLHVAQALIELALEKGRSL